MQKSQPTTTTTSNSTSIPAWLTGAAQSNIANASNLPTATPYTGEGTAGLTPAQLQAIQAALQGNPAATGAVGAGVTGATNAMNFAAPQVSTADIGANIQGLLNPYVGAQIQSTTDELERQRQIQEQKNESANAAQHAFGGDRSGVVDAMNDRDYTTLKNNAITGLLGNSYNTALSTATGVAQGNQSAALQGAGINLSGANSLGNLGTILSQLGTTNINNLLTTGGVQQQTQQTADTFNYNDLLRQIQQMQQNQQLQTQAIQSAPHDTSSSGVQQGQVFSNPLAGIAGLGLGIAGLAGTGGIGGLLGLGGAAGGAASAFLPSASFLDHGFGFG